MADVSAAPSANTGGDGRSHFISASDGLRLHVVEYGARTLPALPVVCLPGLARTAADFRPLAVALASDAGRPRRVLAVDYRGRGLSDYDPDPAHYAYAVELADLDAALAALGVGRAIFIGTSRGGILTMLLAVQQPTRVAGAILNDIGPVVEAEGSMRIKGYVGKLPQPRSLEDGADILRRLHGSQFPKLGPADWLAAAELTWREKNGELALNYDPNLARRLDAIDFEQPLPTLWPQFDALAGAPLMVVRGALSDILSAETLREMRRRRPDMETVEVADEGHPPGLGSADMIRRIAAFVRACEG